MRFAPDPFGINVPVAIVVVYVVVSHVPELKNADVTVIVVMYTLVWKPALVGSDDPDGVATASLVTGRNGRVVSGMVVRNCEVVGVEGTAEGVNELGGGEEGASEDDNKPIDAVGDASCDVSAGTDIDNDEPGTEPDDNGSDVGSDDDTGNPPDEPTDNDTPDEGSDSDGKDSDSGNDIDGSDDVKSVFVTKTVGVDSERLTLSDESRQVMMVVVMVLYTISAG